MALPLAYYLFFFEEVLLTPYGNIRDLCMWIIFQSAFPEGTADSDLGILWLVLDLYKIITSSYYTYLYSHRIHRHIYHGGRSVCED